MNPPSAFDRIMTSLHAAMLDDAHWPTASALIDETCETMGNELVVGSGLDEDVEISLAWFYRRGQRDEELERDYFQHYHARDERLPRLRRLPESRVVRVRDLYTAMELQTSPAFNEALRRARCQDGLNVRLDGSGGSRIVWVMHDPIRPDGWQSSQIALIERLLPFVRQFVRVRQVMAESKAIGHTFGRLIDAARVGVVCLDRRGRIVEVNDRALAILRQETGLFEEDGQLRARQPADDARLQRLVIQALPNFGEQSASGSMTIQQRSGLAPLSVHLIPVPARQLDFGLRQVTTLAMVTYGDGRGAERV